MEENFKDEKSLEQDLEVEFSRYDFIIRKEDIIYLGVFGNITLYVCYHGYRPGRQ